MPELTSFLISDLDVLRTAGALWSALQDEDQHLPDLEQDGTGELAGAHLQARYVRDRDLPLFAVEVVDLRRGAIWEAGVMNIGREAPAAFWRVRAGHADAPAAWTTALEGKVQTPLQPKYRPTFLSVLTAFQSSSGAVLAENIAQRAAVEEDLAYWRELARAQARAIKRLTAASSSAPTRAATFQLGIEPVGADAPTRTWSLREVAEWAALHEGRIAVLPRAITAARKSQYHEPEHVFAGLDLLATTYRAVKLGQAPREQLKEDLDCLGIGIGGSVDPSVAGEAGDEYFVRWGGRRRFLDQHLRKGTARDPTYSMRIYFTWDDEEKVAVVGWLPSHLRCSIT